jgi:hypothetical protein
MDTSYANRIDGEVYGRSGLRVRVLHVNAGCMAANTLRKHALAPGAPLQDTTRRCNNSAGIDRPKQIQSLEESR